MKVRIVDPGAFRDALSFSGIAKGTMEILECALVEAENDTVTVTVSDLSMWLRAKVPAVVEEGGAVAVRAKILEGFVRSIDEPVVIETRGDKVVVSSGETELKLSSYSAEDFPPGIEAETVCTVTVQADALRRALKKLLFIPTKDEFQPTKSSVYLHVVDEELRAVATDGVRLGVVPVGKICDARGTEGLFPKYVMQVLQRLLGMNVTSDVVIEFKPSLAVFSVGPFSLSSPVLGYAYPNYQQVFPEVVMGEVRVNRKQLANALRLSVMTDGIVELSFNHDFLILNTEGDNMVVTDKIRCEVRGKAPRVALKAKFLLEPLMVVDDDEVVMKLSGPLSPVMLEAREYTYVLMPVRLPKEGKDNGRDL